MGLEGYSGRPGRDRGGLFDACMYRLDHNVKFSTLSIYDRKELKNAYQEQKKRFDEVDNKYKEVLQKCNEMEKAIKQNARVMDTMKPFLCGVKNCPNRKSITFDTNNN